MTDASSLPQKRRRRWLGGVAFSLAFLIAASLIFYQCVLPGIIESRLNQAIRDMGLTDAAVRVEAVSTSALHLSDFRAGGLHIPAARITYNITQLRSGQVDTIDLYGPTYRIGLLSQGVDLGPLVTWIQQQAQGDNASNSELPFNTIHIHAGELTLSRGDAAWVVPINGSFGRGSVHVDYAASIVAQLPGATVNVQSDSEIPLTVSLHAAGHEAVNAVFDQTGDGHIAWRWEGQPAPALRDALAIFGIKTASDSDLLFAGTCYWLNGSLRIEDVAFKASHLTIATLRDLSCDMALNGSLTDGTLALRLRENSHITTAEYGRINLQNLGNSPAIAWGDTAMQWAVEAATAKPITLTVGTTKLVGLTAAMPVTSQAHTAGTWSIEQAHVSGMTLQNIEGAVGMVGTTLHFEAETFPINNTVGDWVVAGDIAINGDVAFNGEKIKPHVTLEAFDTSAINEPLGVAAEGVTGSITIDSLDPLSTPGGQRVYAKRVLFNRIALEDGHVVFRLESPQSLLIERTHWRFDQEGRMWAHGFRVNPDAVAFDAQLFIQDMPLMRWVSELSDKRIAGQGRFHGRLPINYDARRKHRFQFGEGYLYANPGPGEFRVGDVALIDGLLTDSGIDFASDRKMQALKVNLIEAMKDFEYSRLQLDFIPEESGMLTRLHIAGKGLKGQKQEIGGITFNIRGLQQVLNSVMLLKSGSEGGLQDALRRLLAKPK